MATATKRRPNTKGVSGVDLRVLAAAGALMAAAVMSWLMWVSPLMANVDAVQDQVDSTIAQTSAARAKVEALRSGQVSEAEGLLEQARSLDALLPGSVDKVQVAGQVPALAERRGLSVQKMDPADAGAPSGPVGSLTFAMAVSGSYEQILSFLDELTSSDNQIGLMGVEGVSLTSSESTASATFTLNVFHATTPSLTEPGS